MYSKITTIKYNWKPFIMDNTIALKAKYTVMNILFVDDVEHEFNKYEQTDKQCILTQSQDSSFEFSLYIILDISGAFP